MKKTLLLIFLLISLHKIYADQEKLSVLVRSGGNDYWIENSSSSLIGNRTPCEAMNFKVTYSTPAGYSFNKFEWYNNGVLVKTQTNQEDYGAEVILKATTTNIVCVITYSNGPTLITKSSNTFPISAKPLAISISQLNDAISGCTNPVAFATIPISNQFLYTPTSYTATWLPPNNWSLNTLSSDGHNASFIPSGTTTGKMAVDVILGCGFVQTIKTATAITRTTPETNFTENAYIVCNGTTTKSFSVNAACGASTYTYTIQGTTKSKFTANSSQTITTSASTVSITFQQNTSYSFVLLVKVNYPAGSSETRVANIQFGNPAPQLGVDVECPEAYGFATGDPDASYTWRLINFDNNTETVYPNQGITKTFHNVSGSINICVEYKNSCGTSPATCYYNECETSGYKRLRPDSLNDKNSSTLTRIIDENLMIYPNPAKEKININIGNVSKVKELTGLKVVALYTAYGQLIGKQEYMNMPTNVTFSLNGVFQGIYFLKLSDGKTEVIKKIIVEK